MPTDERYVECRNCRRMQPPSLINKEGRCQTCGPSETPVTAADPSEVGPHGEQEAEGTEGQPPAGEGFPAPAAVGDQPPGAPPEAPPQGATT
jgi:hypothetical protein